MARSYTLAGEPLAAGQAYRLIRGEGVSFEADESALAALDRMVRDGVRAFPKRGLEIGGLLMGTCAAGEIRLNGVQPLPMEYRTGPAFQPSPADLLYMKQAAGTGILGHFRSQTSGEPGPSGVDDTIPGVLGLDEALLLLVPASAAGVEPARLYRGVNGEWKRLLSFPLVESPVEPPASVRLPQPGMRGAGHRRYQWLLGGIAAGLACGAVLGHSIQPSPPAIDRPVSSTDLHLELQPSGPALKVEWNAASPVVAQASSAMLKVQDGGRYLQIPLDRQQLQSGNTAYYPETGWVEARLEIYRDNTHFVGETAAAPFGLPKAELPPETAAPKAPPRRKPAAKSAGRRHRGRASRLPPSFDPLN
ncbi:MAG TPA: hypothetical protein VKV17_18935 [Bryobacteraceae bacterium]|nr:hypothetical protein [Bryobacteraceae bacterium]